MGEWAIPGDTAAERKRLEQLMEARRFEADGRQCQDLRPGWVLGSDEFREELLAQAGQWLGPNHYGTVRRETAEVAARRMIAERLRKERPTPEKLPLLSASHPIKVPLAQQLRQQTTMGLKWIAQELATAVGNTSPTCSVGNKAPPGRVNSAYESPQQRG